MATQKLGTPMQTPIEELHYYHANPRVGNVEKIKESITVNGVFRPIVVNAGSLTGRPMEVLAGNHTLKALRQLNLEQPDNPTYQTVDTWLVDVTDEQATRIVLADNRTADLGEYDNEQLLDLLESIDDDLDGTGYEYDDLESLRALLEVEENPTDDTPDDPPAKVCQACGYDVTNNPDDLTAWGRG